MSFTPRSVGDASAIHNTFHTDSGIYPLGSLLASALAMHFIDTGNSILRVGTGTWSITDAPNGKADYAPSAADVATAGAFSIYPVVTLTTGPKAFDPQILELRFLP
jgi:hypothetical protein